MGGLRSRQVERRRGKRPRLYSTQLHPLRGRRQLPCTRYRGNEEAVERYHGTLRRGAQGGRRAQGGHGSRVHAHLARPRLYRQGPRKDSRIADRRALQALAAALRRHKDGRTGAQHVRLPDRARDQGDLHKVPQDAQRRRLRRIYPRNAPCPPRAHPHRPARHLRQGQDSGRLPPRGALRHRLSRRLQGARQGQHRRRHDARQGARSRGARRPD